MTTPTPPSLPALIRYWLGTDRIPHLEEHVASAKDQLTALDAKVTDLIADVKAATDILQAKVGQLDAEGQAAMDTLVAKVDAFDSEVGDADGSDTPTGPVDAPPAV